MTALTTIESSTNPLAKVLMNIPGMSRLLDVWVQENAAAAFAFVSAPRSGDSATMVEYRKYAKELAEELGGGNGDIIGSRSIFCHAENYTFACAQNQSLFGGVKDFRLSHVFSEWQAVVSRPL